MVVVTGNVAEIKMGKKHCFKSNSGHISLKCTCDVNTGTDGYLILPLLRFLSILEVSDKTFLKSSRLFIVLSFKLG